MIHEKGPKLTPTAAYADHSEIDYNTEHHYSTFQDTGERGREPSPIEKPVTRGFSAWNLAKNYRHPNGQSLIMMNDHTNPAPYDKVSSKYITVAQSDREEFGK